MVRRCNLVPSQYAEGVSCCDLQGQVLGGSTIRISWGRSSTSRAAVNAAAAAAAPYPGAFPVAAAGYGAAGAAAYGIGAFDANGYGSFGAAPAAPTATSDPYAAYYAAAVSNPEAALYTVSLRLWLALPLICILMSKPNVCGTKMQKHLATCSSAFYSSALLFLMCSHVDLTLACPM